MKKVYALFMRNEETDFTNSLLSVHETEKSARIEQENYYNLWKSRGLNYNRNELFTLSYYLKS